MTHRIHLICIVLAALIHVRTMAGATAMPRYSMSDLAGSYMPYPQPDAGITLPDSLIPVMMNHVGRHGARFPTSPDAELNLLRALVRADSLGTITPTGSGLMSVVKYVISKAHDRWGQLDSLGMEEQRGIALRMYHNFPELFGNNNVNARSSYVPRCVMSMYEFTHQLDLLDNKIEISTSSGPINSPLLRPFETDSAYVAWRKADVCKNIYDRFLQEHMPSTAIRRALGEGYPFDGNRRSLALDEYSVIIAMVAMGENIEPAEFFTYDEYRSIWECVNLRQYLQRTSTSVSALPGEITSDLIKDIIAKCDGAVAGEAEATVFLRFGHAETLMPLLCQLRVPGCRYETDDFDMVALHWCNFRVVPMASNLQLLLSRTAGGCYYLTVYLNERPVSLIPGDSRLVIPYVEARRYMLECCDSQTML